MSRKALVRKSKQNKKNIFIEFIEEFLTHSSIHGLNQLTRKGRHLIEKIVTLAVVLAAVYGAFVLNNLTLSRYINNPTVTSVERDPFSWNTSFPSATICPEKKVNLVLLDEFLKASKDIDNKDLYKQFVISLLNANYYNLDSILEYGGLSGDQLAEIFETFHFNFTPTVSDSALSDRHMVMQKTMTEMGICYSFNSQIAVYNSFEYWKNNSWKLLPDIESIYVHPLDGEVFGSVMNLSTGYDVYFHGPHEVPDISSKYTKSPEGNFNQISLSGLTIFTTERAKRLRVNQRKCRLYYESDLKHSPVYSYVLCRMECRLTLAKKLCGCIPHFYRKLGGETYCDVAGLHCLAKYKDQLILVKNGCSCLANCDDVNFVIEVIYKREWFLGTNFQWSFYEYPKMRLKRDVIFGFSDLLVSIGGMVGLFLGCSVLSIAEIVYFFTLRLYWFIVKYDKRRK